MVKELKLFIKQLFCDHEWKSFRNVFSDEVDIWKRGFWWHCPKCELTILMDTQPTEE